MATVHVRRYLASLDWLTGHVWGVRSPYSSDAIDALKARIRGRDRQWVRLERGGIWVVAEHARETLKSILVEHYGEHELCRRCCAGEPCWVWREIDEQAEDVGLKGASMREEPKATPPPPPPPKQPPPRERVRSQRTHEWRAGETFDEFFARSFGGTSCGGRRPPRGAPERDEGMSVREAAAVLGVSEGASAAEVKTAFRRAAFAAHPDREGGSDSAMKRVNAAKAVFDVLHSRAGVRA